MYHLLKKSFPKTDLILELAVLAHSLHSYDIGFQL